MTRPHDTVGFIGDTAVLQCRSNDSQLSMSWLHFDRLVASSTRGVLVNNSRLSLNRSVEGQFDLVINSTRSYNAGRYQCTEGYDIIKAELTLLGKCFVSVLFVIILLLAFAICIQHDIYLSCSNQRFGILLCRSVKLYTNCNSGASKPREE